MWPEKTHDGTGRICKCHTERPEHENMTNEDFSISPGDSTNHKKMHGIWVVE